MKANIRKIIRSIIREQTETKEGVLEDAIVEAFKSMYPHLAIKNGSVKVDKIDTTRDRILGTLRYTLKDMDVGSSFIFRQKAKLLAIGEE